ncbi:MAG: hypothetical protein AB7E79_02375 [Rhodospirillaceae bacterium]
MRRAAGMVALALLACGPPLETHQTTFDAELRFFEARKGEEAWDRLGWILNEAGGTPFGDVWLFVSDKTGTSDKWLIWQEVHVGQSLTSGLRFLYRDQKSGTWFLYDTFQGAARGPETLEAKTAEQVFAKVTPTDAVDASHFHIFPRAWYLTLYDGRTIVRKAVLANAREPAAVAGGVYKDVADIVAAIRGLAPWPPPAGAGK